MPKQIVGSVHWIENGRQTNRLVDVREAFGDLDQARSQVQFAEASGDKKEIRLVRLAYRQVQGMRFRGEGKAKPKRATKVDQQRVAKTAKSPKTKSGGKTAGRRSAKKIAKRKLSDRKPVHTVNGERFS